jgi:hypothetical protein
MNSTVEAEPDTKTTLSFPVRVINLCNMDEGVLSSLRDISSDGLDVQILSSRDGIYDPGYLPSEDFDPQAFERFLGKCGLGQELLPQHLRQLIRFMEPALLVVIALDSDAVNIGLARQIEKISGVLGIDTLIFSPIDAVVSSSTFARAGFFSQVVPLSGNDPSHWPQVLTAILSSVFRPGIVCVDWWDMPPFIFDDTPVANWSCATPEALSRGVTGVAEWIEAELGTKSVERLLLVLQFDSAFGMSDLKSILSTVRTRIGTDAKFVVAAPNASLPSVTTVWA